MNPKFSQHICFCTYSSWHSFQIKNTYSIYNAKIKKRKTLPSQIPIEIPEPHKQPRGKEPSCTAAVHTKLETEWIIFLFQETVMSVLFLGISVW
jgi:hypothetical protein